MSFARTKIQPPRFRDGLIERGDLERRLGAALLAHRLVLLVAPAGYGKTAALSRQLALLPEGSAAVWVTADEHDDLPRLLACLTEALEPYDPPWRVDPEVLASQVSQERGLRPVVDELVNALAAIPVELGVIALDDMHCVADSRVFDFLGALLERLPQNWALAIAARTAPPLALARLRAQRELAAFGQADLSFSAQEIRHLSVATGEEDSEEMAQSLLRHTQGWAAGLCLSLNAGRGSAKTVAGRRLSRRHLFEYLTSEVFEQMPDELREFLMRCSVLPELTADRCAVVSGNPRAADLLDDIERRGLFVSVLHSEEFTLRLHDLFRDFLEDRLREQHADEIPQLLRRAAEGESDPVRRMNILLRAGAWAEAEQLLDSMALRMLAKGDGAQVMRLVEQFPAELQAQSPQLAYLRGLWARFRFAFPVMAQEMHRAAAGFEQRGDRRNAERARAYEACALMYGRQHAQGRAILASLDKSTDLEVELAKEQCCFWDTLINGPADAPGPHLNRRAELLSRSADSALWYLYLPEGQMLLVGRPGVRAAAQRIVHGALAVAADGWPLLQAEAHGLEAVLLLCQGRLAEADVVMQQLRADAHWAGIPRNVRFRIWMLTALHAAMRSDREAVHAALAERDFVASLDTAVNVMTGLCNAAAGSWGEVAQALAAWKDEAEMRGSFWAPFHGLLGARLALHERRHAAVLQVLREAVKTSAQIDRMGLDAMVRISLAVAENRTGSSAAAWRAVAPLVDHVRSAGDVGGILLCGVELLAELARGPWASAAPPEELAEVKRWAELSRQAQTSAAPGEPDPARHAAFPLSGRELEVLECIAAGDSNKLIARALNLSPHTVKRHVARILDRLDLSSRGEAAAWYRERAS